MPSTETMPSLVMRRSSFKTARKGSAGSGQQGRLLLGEGLGHDPARGAVDAGIGDPVEPVLELPVEVVEITEAAALEEVLADVAERPLHLALGLGPVGPAGLGSQSRDGRRGRPASC